MTLHGVPTIFHWGPRLDGPIIEDEGREQGQVLGDRQWAASPLLNICGVWGSAVSSPSGVRDDQRFSTIFSTQDGLY